jgi:hypothetical protein
LENPPKKKAKKAAKLPLLEPDDLPMPPPQPPAAAPEPKPPPAKPPPPPKPAIQPIGAAADLLQRAVANTADSNGWADFSDVATTVRELAPDFNPKSYGCSKLSLLFTRNGQFEVRRDKKKQIYVRLLPLPVRGSP